MLMLSCSRTSYNIGSGPKAKSHYLVLSQASHICSCYCILLQVYLESRAVNDPNIRRNSVSKLDLDEITHDQVTGGYSLPLSISHYYSLLQGASQNKSITA